jgi:hypothetical protein
MWYDEEEKKWKPFGSSHVSDAYFEMVSVEQYDLMIRDMIMKNSVEVLVVPIEDTEAIAIEIKEDGTIVYSKGWRDFFKFKM